MEHSRYHHICADSVISFPAVSSAGVCLVSDGLHHRRADGCAGRLAGKKNWDGQPVRRKAGQRGGFAVLRCPDTPAFSCFMAVVSGDNLVCRGSHCSGSAFCYATAYYKYHQFAALHTWLNKLTGVAVFLLPYVLAVFPGVTYSWAVCLLALAAAAEEWMIHLCRAEYCADRKSFFALKWRKVKNDTGTNCRNRPV